jgi:hypothetical protein
MEIGQIAVLLLGVALGWFLLFAVRRNRVHWGAFATFMSVILGTTLMKFLYANDLLPYYAIGLFIGFFANVVVRAAGTILGGRVGEGLLEISAFSMKREAVGSDDMGRGQEGEGEV